MFCTVCGTQLRGGVKFCTKCGAKAKIPVMPQTAVPPHPVYAPPAPAKKSAAGTVAVVITVVAVLCAAGALAFNYTGAGNAARSVTWKTKKYACYNRVTYSLVLLELALTAPFISHIEGTEGTEDAVVAVYDKGSSGYAYIEERFGGDTYLAVSTDKTYVLVWEDATAGSPKRWSVVYLGNAGR